MLFNSIGFLFFFLPLSVVGYYLLPSILNKKWLTGYLALISLIFYAIGSPKSLPIFLVSVAVNFAFANLISKAGSTPLGIWLLRAGVTANFACLAWFKYMHFAVSNFNDVFGTDYEFATTFLPLGISFFTFKQIAYLVDVFHGDVAPGNAIDHLFNVVFFPQLIAGPITLHRDMTRQLIPERMGRFGAANIVIGMSIFAVGLFKRTVLSDTAAPFADDVFNKLKDTDGVTFVTAWVAALCYLLQLYFDFSGYSDMAVGVSRMFGLKIPINFYSPLKATSIIDYWRRWHITLQRIIGRYFFQPLLIPISRFAAERDFGKWGTFWVVTAFPTILTFALLGLWHGAGWKFVIFGLIHGAYATINEIWRVLFRKQRKKIKGQIPRSNLIGYHILTIACVAFAIVFFRADTLSDAMKISLGMLNPTTITLSQLAIPTTWSGFLGSALPVIVTQFAIVLLLPNTTQVFHKFASILEPHAWDSINSSLIEFKWRPTMAWSAIMGVLFCLGVIFMLRVQTNFIYFNF